MRPITEIIVHCTASPEKRPMTVKQIDDIHRNERHWANGIGYHKVIYLDDTIEEEGSSLRLHKMQGLSGILPRCQEILPLV